MNIFKLLFGKRKKKDSSYFDINCDPETFWIRPVNIANSPSQTSNTPLPDSLMFTSINNELPSSSSDFGGFDGGSFGGGGASDSWSDSSSDTSLLD